MVKVQFCLKTRKTVLIKIENSPSNTATIKILGLMDAITNKNNVYYIIF